MDLPNSRGALEAAAWLLDLVAAFQPDPPAFAQRFPLAAAAVFRVGEVIDKETQGRRTQVFGNWWASVREDPRFAQMRDIRNAEFKGAEVTHQQARLGFADVATRFAVAESADSVLTGPSIRVIRRPRRRSSVRQRPSSGASTIAYLTDQRHGGVEVVGFLQSYLTWMRDEVLPTAESLMG